MPVCLIPAILLRAVDDCDGTGAGQRERPEDKCSGNGQMAGTGLAAGTGTAIWAAINCLVGVGPAANTGFATVTAASSCLAGASTGHGRRRGVSLGCLIVLLLILAPYAMGKMASASSQVIKAARDWHKNATKFSQHPLPAIVLNGGSVASVVVKFRQEAVYKISSASGRWLLALADQIEKTGGKFVLQVPSGTLASGAAGKYGWDLA